MFAARSLAGAVADAVDSVSPIARPVFVVELLLGLRAVMS